MRKASHEEGNSRAYFRVLKTRNLRAFKDFQNVLYTALIPCLAAYTTLIPCPAAYICYTCFPTFRHCHPYILQHWNVLFPLEWSHHMYSCFKLPYCHTSRVLSFWVAFYSPMTLHVCMWNIVESSPASRILSHWLLSRCAFLGFSWWGIYLVYFHILPCISMPYIYI